MKKYGFIASITLMCMFTSGCNSQSTDTTKKFQKMYGWEHSDIAHSIKQTGDGGYIVAGEKSVNQIYFLINLIMETDYYIIRLDSSGEIIWEKNFGSFNKFSYATSVLQTRDGGFIVAGYTDEDSINNAINHGGADSYTNDAYVVKLDADGNIEWENMYGGASDEEINSIQQTTDGGYILAGSSYSTDINGTINGGGWDIYAIKLNGNGDIEWQRLYGSSNIDSSTSIRQTIDGGYIIAGYSKDSEHEKSVILKLDSSGGVQWQQLYDCGKTYDIQTTSDGGYIVAGNKLFKLDENGAAEWEVELQNFAYGVVQTQDGGYAAILDYPCSMLRLDSSGNTLWTTPSLGGTASTSPYWRCDPIEAAGGDNSGYDCGFKTDPSDDHLVSIQATNDGGCILAGYSNAVDISGVTNNGDYDFYVVKLDSKGNIAVIE